MFPVTESIQRPTYNLDELLEIGPKPVAERLFWASTTSATTEGTP